MFLRFLFLCAYLGIRHAGPEWTIQAFRTWGERFRRFTPPVFHYEPQSMEAKMERSYRFLPFPVRCFEQSIVSWFCLNLSGRAASILVGLELSPLMAHAWVKCEGELLVAIPRVGDLRVMAEYGPWPGARLQTV